MPPRFYFEQISLKISKEERKKKPTFSRSLPVTVEPQRTVLGIINEIKLVKNGYFYVNRDGPV
jgi:hypothetical protein